MMAFIDFLATGLGYMVLFTCFFFMSMILCCYIKDSWDLWRRDRKEIRKSKKRMEENP